MSETEYVLVPKVPTEAMIEAGRAAGNLAMNARAIHTYQAMIAASPAPAASRGWDERIGSVRRMLEKVTGPTDSVRVYAHEAKMILAALPDAPAPAKDGEGEG